MYNGCTHEEGSAVKLQHLIVETFSTAVEYKWGRRDRNYSEGHFNVAGIQYTVQVTGGRPIQTADELAACEADEDATMPVVAPGYEWYWDVAFHATIGGDNVHTSTGTGNQWVVYSTVIEMVRNHMTTFGEGPLYMSAFDDSRQRLYPRMLRRLLKHWTIVTSDEGYEFVAYPPGVSGTL